MRYLLTFLLAPLLSIPAFAQTGVRENIYAADSLLKINKTAEAYQLYKTSLQSLPETDSLYRRAVWYYIGATTALENQCRMKEDFSGALKYGLEALKAIQDNKRWFDQKFATREPWMIKNILVSDFALGRMEEAVKYRAMLYKGYQDKTLPDGLDHYFNFDFFRLDNKNIWGYEWYPELPDDRNSSSFTKVVYYVYSTNPDGSDKDQLYRLHVLMFHKMDGSGPDYVLTKTYDTDSEEISGTYYKYPYSKNIDYTKLKEDVKTVVHTELQPDTRRIIPRRK